MKQMIVLYDKPRSVWVKLNDIIKYIGMRKVGANYWYLIAQNPTEYWTSDNEFVTDSGHFTESDNKAIWVEKQGNSFCRFLRIL